MLVSRCYTINFLPTTFATYLNEIFYLLQRFGIFFLFEKENACKRKAKQGGNPLYPRERRAAVYGLCFSVGSSAHSPVNSLRSNSTGSCGLQSKPFPRSSQLGCTTAARLLEACSSRFIKSLALPFLLFFPQLPLRRAVYTKILPKGFSSGRIAVLLCI